MKRTKEELKIVFENGDRPNQEDFWDWQDSYWHKDDDIPKEKIENLNNLLNEKANTNASNAEVEAWQNKLEIDDKINSAIKNINYTWSPTNRTLTLYDRAGNQLSQVSLLSLDNEGTDLRYNASTLSLELWNADNQLLDSIPVSSFIGSVATQLQLNSNQLSLKDSQGNILSTVTFEISNINGLQAALDGKINKPTIFASYPSTSHKFIPVIDSTGDAKKLNLSTILDPKLDKPTMTNNYYGLWDDTNKKFVNGIEYADGSTLRIDKYGGNFTGNLWSWNYWIATNQGGGKTNALIKIGDYIPFNIPVNSGLSSTLGSIQSGDLLTADQNLYFAQNRNNSGIRLFKLSGLQPDDTFDGNGTADFNTLTSKLGSNTSGASGTLYVSNYTYGNKLSANVTNKHPDMWDGALMTVGNGYSNSGYQLYWDTKGQLFTRANGGWTAEKRTWNKALMDDSENLITTTLGSSTNYSKVKWAVDSTTQGALIAPRMTTTQRTAITGLNTTQTGMVVFDTDLGFYMLWTGSAWTTLGANISNTNLTNTVARTFTQNASFTWATLGNPYYWTGLLDKTNNTTYSKKLCLNPSTGEIVTKDNADPTDVTNAINAASAAQKTSMRIALLGTATPASPTISHCFPSFISKEVSTNIDLNGLNLTLLDPVQIWIEAPDGTKVYATNFMNYSTTLVRTTWLIPSTFPDGTYSVKIQNGVASQGLSTGTLTISSSFNTINLYDSNWKNILKTTSDTGATYTINNTWLNNNIRALNYMRTQLPINNEDYLGSDETGGNLFMTNNFIQINKDYEIIIETNINIGYPGTGAAPNWWLGLTKTESSTIVNISDVIKDNYIDGNQSGFWGIVNTSLGQFYKIVLYKTGNQILAKLFDPNGTFLNQKQWTISNFDNNLSLFIRDFRQRTTHAIREFKFTIKEKP